MAKSNLLQRQTARLLPCHHHRLIESISQGKTLLDRPTIELARRHVSATTADVYLLDGKVIALASITRQSDKVRRDFALTVITHGMCGIRV